jgi:hypothetical protein
VSLGSVQRLIGGQLAAFLAVGENTLRFNTHCSEFE